VPDVLGKDPNAAADELRAAGYTVEVNDKSLLCRIDASLCKVAAQDPSSGSELATGSSVTIDIDAP
jgi:beta-lactam-binding protein with PASTA domain